jgi:hypothetical protein
MRHLAPALATLVILVVAACSGSRPPAGTPGPALRVAPDIAARRAQLVPMPMTADLSTLDRGDREALGYLLAAARVMDELFLRQAWSGNPDLVPQVAALKGPIAEPARDYYRIMFGPWDRLADSEPFLGTARRPTGAGFYPEDMTKEEFEGHLAAHPESREAFTSTVTVIQRDEGKLVAVPYSKVWRELLQRAATELRAAAAATSNASLRRFLRSRADAFLSDDYYASDMDWMDLDSEIEIVIGPYETYEDSLFGYKAAFEAFVCIVQPAESQRLEVYKSELPALERALPIPEEHKNLSRGSESPIRVADEIFSAGDTKAGVQTLAFNLPNDERVREAKGSKKVMLKNVMHAKYDAILVPIAARVLPVGESSRLDFDSYFHHILFHELAHGLGPGRIVKDGRSTEARLELKELYSAIEEAKADVVGALDLYILADRGVVPAAVVDPLPWTVVAGLFRAARFGATEAHGLGVVIQTNFMLANGAIEVAPDGRFRPVPERFRAALEELAHELLMAEALGDYDVARAIVSRYGTVPPAMATLLASFKDIPVDIEPIFGAEQRPGA